MRYLSLFSGMEAAHLAWASLGWECAAVAEIEPAACALLRHRLPHVPNLGDVTMITDAAIATLDRIDVVIGGSPCQDLSVAGKRAGLAGARSGLFHEQLRIFNAARTLCGARWLVWENVPGAFSSNKGCDFAVVVGAMAGCPIDVPAGGWGNEGVALGENGLVEWSVLDAQWFGVAQRRRRVFAVLDTGDWAGRPPVLLEPESLRGDSAPRREAGEGVAGTLAPGAHAGSYNGQDAGAGLLIPALARCVTTGEGIRQDWETCTIIPTVAHTLRADGFDASEDGTGRGTPIIPIDMRQASRGATMTNKRAEGSTGGAPGTGVGNDGDPSPTLSTSHVPAIAFAHQGGGVQTTLGYDPESGTAPTLSVGQTPAVHVAMAIRRLTPRECEQLQGAPDNWTLVPNAKGKPMADGPRYKMLGNSFAVPVIRWIGKQIAQAHGLQKMQEAA
jgi:DNA (cytosine-5)-methyltransferase 1